MWGEKGKKHWGRRGGGNEAGRQNKEENRVSEIALISRRKTALRPGTHPLPDALEGLQVVKAMECELGLEHAKHDDARTVLVHGRKLEGGEPSGQSVSSRPAKLGWATFHGGIPLSSRSNPP